MPCLAVPEIHDFVTGRLDARSVARVDEHLDSCELCREIVASAGMALGESSSDAGSSAQLLLPAGTLLDRFEIEEVIGRGAMGVVYAARDPRLDRRVALKLLRADRKSSAQSEELMLEAQAMARLAHPNVVAVYDVGPVAEGEDELYVAMELVEGISLGEWISAEDRRWPDIVELVCAAGQGLWAAHQSGICHRDFKPDNIIVGNDGRARVTDFGLARLPAPRADGALAVSMEHTLTSLSGTPAYMAPELFSSAQASEKSDQFSYCVTLFEALYGHRPFDGEGLERLVANASAGAILWPKQPRLPRRVVRVLERGLRPDPGERYPSMGELLRDLPAAPKSRRRIVGVALASAAAAGIAATLLVSSFSGSEKDPCADATSKLDAVWGHEQRGALEGALRASSSEVSTKTLAGLARFTRSWSNMRIESCEATAQRHEQSDELFDLRTQCLDRRLSEMVVLQQQIAIAPASELVNAPLWADALGDLHHCEDPVALRAQTPLPADPALRAEISSIQRELDRIAVMVDSNEVVKARELATTLLARSRELGYQPLVGEALQVQASALLEAGELDAADAALREALRIASTALDHLRVADLSNTRILLVGLRQQKFEAALALAEAARAAVAQAGNDPLRVANLHVNAGAVYDMAGKREQAETELMAALELYRNMSGHSAEIASTLHNLAVQAMESGDRELAQARFEESLALRQDVFGSSHPTVAQSSLGLGALARRDNQLDAARKHYERAQEIYTDVFGADYAGLGAVHNNLAIVCVEEKDYTEAERQHRRALDIRMSQYGAEHPLVAQSYSGLGNVLLEQGRPTEALVLHTDSVALRKRAYPADHPSIAIGLHGLAGALSAVGQYDEAIEHRREALRMFVLAEADAADLAEIQFDLARDLWSMARPVDRKEAVTLAAEARRGFEHAGASSAEALAAVTSWLAERS